MRLGVQDRVARGSRHSYPRGSGDGRAPGRRRSASTRSTRASGAWARAPARLMAVIVLPSPMAGLDTATTLRSAVLCSCSMVWRSARYCSASKAAGATRLTRCSSTPSGGSATGDPTLGLRRLGCGGAGRYRGRAAGGTMPARRARSRSACSSALKNLLIAGAGRALTAQGPRARRLRSRALAGSCPGALRESEPRRRPTPPATVQRSGVMRHRLSRPRPLERGRSPSSRYPIASSTMSRPMRRTWSA